MIQSMTGYGEATYSHIHCELKALNHRFFDATLSIPTSLSCYEFKIITLLKERIKRGAVFLKIFVEETHIKLDIKRAKAYYDFINNLKLSLGLEESSIPIDLFLNFTKQEAPPWSVVKKVINSCIDCLIESRLEEGKKLLSDIETHFKKINKLLQVIDQRVPKQKERREQFLKRITPLIKDGLDEHKIDEEFAFLLMKEDFNEEQSRLKAHFKKFKNILYSKRPSGKYLVFLIQEMQREANTISAKVKDVGVSQVVVELKKELEDLREQAENVS
ncbi:MAG: DUF1732 domain-containing protein [bacterium]|nr:DUF1732 domain-containing protein [bacterium]